MCLREQSAAKVDAKPTTIILKGYGKNTCRKKRKIINVWLVCCFVEMKINDFSLFAHRHIQTI